MERKGRKGGWIEEEQGGPGSLVAGAIAEVFTMEV